MSGTSQQECNHDFAPRGDDRLVCAHCGLAVGLVPTMKEINDAVESWPEERADALGQNGNDGLHYADPVNHPDHYQSADGIECIDAIRAALGLEGFVAHCRGTAIKYAWRSGKKQKHAEDLRKAAWYLTRAAEAMEGES